MGQGGAIFNTGEKILVYKKNTVEFNEVLATEKLAKKTMQRYRKYIQSEGKRELVEEFKSASNGLRLEYRHTDYVIGNISLKNFESRKVKYDLNIISSLIRYFELMLFNKKMNFKMHLCLKWEKIVYIPWNTFLVEDERR